MRFLNTSGLRQRRSHLVRVTRDAAIVASAAAIVLAGAACSGKSKQATPTPTPPPQAAGAAKKAADVMKTELKPLNAPVPLPLRKLDGLTVSMNPVLPAMKDLSVKTDVGKVPFSIGAIAVPAFSVNMNIGGPSLGSLLSGLGAPPAAIPTMPTTIPTAPPGAPAGATPPPGFATPPAGFPTPPPGFGPPAGMPSLPPGFTIPGLP